MKNKKLIYTLIILAAIVGSGFVIAKPADTELQVGQTILFKTTVDVLLDTGKIIVGPGERDVNTQCFTTEYLTQVVVSVYDKGKEAQQIHSTHDLPPGTILGPFRKWFYCGESGCKWICQGFHMLEADIISLPGKN